MTAVGLVMIVVGIGYAISTDEKSRRQWVKSLAGLSIILGALAMFAGIVVKLWEVMP